jgi:hypothetical protein
MRRHEVEHVLRAAAAITGHREWVIVGSQAILGSCPDAAAELLVSQEVDLYATGNERASDLVDGSIGERSPFHESFGYYAHGVGPETAILPAEWRSRAVRIESPATGGAFGLCPEAADLAISKIVAWREKDRDFVKSLLRHQIVTIRELNARLPEVPENLVDEVTGRLKSLARE